MRRSSGPTLLLLLGIVVAIERRESVKENRRRVEVEGRVRVKVNMIICLFRYCFLFDARLIGSR